jgi:hypothetical protein
MPRVIILSQLYLTNTIEKDLSNKIWGYLTCKNGDLTIINGKSIYGSWISTSQNWFQFHTSYIPHRNRVAMKGGSKRVSQGMEPCNTFSVITWKLTWPDKPQKIGAWWRFPVEHGYFTIVLSQHIPAYERLKSPGYSHESHPWPPRRRQGWSLVFARGRSAGTRVVTPEPTRPSPPPPVIPDGIEAP